MPISHHFHDCKAPLALSHWVCSVKRRYTKYLGFSFISGVSRRWIQRKLTPPDFGSKTTLTKSGMSRFSWLWSLSWSSTSSTSTGFDRRQTNLVSVQYNMQRATHVYIPPRQYAHLLSLSHWAHQWVCDAWPVQCQNYRTLHHTHPTVLLLQ